MVKIVNGRIYKVSKRNKILIVAASAVLAIVLIAFAMLYFNGFSGIHHHTTPKDGQIKVACIGDSTTYGHGVAGWPTNNYPAQLQKMLGDKYHVSNFGQKGSTVSDDGDQPYTETKQFKKSLEYDADIIVIMLGANDTKPENWTDIKDFIDRYDALIKRYKENNPDVKIILCTPTKAFFSDGKKDGTTDFDIQPEHVESIVYHLRVYGLTNGLEVVDVYDLTRNHAEWFAEDNVHPSKDGARAIAELIAKKINK